MPAPFGRSAADHLAALNALLPQGPIWSRDGESTIGRVCLGIATTAARLRARADALLVDAFPATALELLPEWEATLGLPDPCSGPNPTLQQRRGQVVARLSGRGGQSIAYYVARAAALGFTISVQEYAPARVGLMRVGDRVQGEEWAHVWAIRAPRQTVTPFRVGLSAVGERLQTFGNAVLECELQAIKPAHTILQFQYL